VVRRTLKSVEFLEGRFGSRIVRLNGLLDRFQELVTVRSAPGEVEKSESYPKTQDTHVKP
jgi:hypothetical protein